MKVISGAIKGRNIVLTSVQKNNKDMRPTTNYTKNVLFNMLRQNPVVARNIVDAKVLDCFCGTGAIGFEFASRGASLVHFVDSDEKNIAQIHKNAQNFEINYNARVGFFPHVKIKEEFDIIFVDPPYVAAQSQILKTLRNLFDQSLAKDGLMILEIPNEKHSSLMENIAKKFTIVLKKEVSDKTVLLFLANFS